jgi:hypothetical protein
MKMPKVISQKLSYVYLEKENSIYLKSVIDKTVGGQVTYDRIGINGAGINFEVIYKKKPLTGTAEPFNDAVEIKLDIKVQVAGDVTKKKLKAIIKDYLKKFGPNAKISLNVVFKEPDGSTEDSKVTGISEDADIDLID